MKEVRRYACQYCGAEYKEKKSCIKCEKQHKRPTGIVAADYSHNMQDKYPSSMDILMNDGETVRYTIMGKIVRRQGKEIKHEIKKD